MDDLKFVSVAARENPWVGLRSRLRRFQLLSILYKFVKIVKKYHVDFVVVMRSCRLGAVLGFFLFVHSLHAKDPITSFEKPDFDSVYQARFEDIKMIAGSFYKGLAVQRSMDFEDLMQEAFLIAFKHWERFDPAKVPSGVEPLSALHRSINWKVKRGLIDILRRDIIPKSEMDRWYVIRDVHDQWLQEKGIPPTEDQAMEIIKRDYIGKFKDKNSGREPEQDLIEKELGRYRDLKTRGMFSSSLDQQVDAFDPNSDSLGSKLAQRREVGPAHLPTVREEVLKYLEEDRAFIKQWLAGVLELPDDSFAGIPGDFLAAAMFMLEGGGVYG